MYLVNLFLIEIVNIVAIEPEPEANNCNYLKYLLLKSFKLYQKSVCKNLYRTRKNLYRNGAILLLS